VIKYICKFCGEEHISYADTKLELNMTNSKNNWIESNNYGWYKP